MAISKQDLDIALGRAGYHPVSDDVYIGLGKSSEHLKSKTELAMFLTQVLWESGGLKSRLGSGDDVPPAVENPARVHSTKGYGKSLGPITAVDERIGRQDGGAGTSAQRHGVYLEIAKVLGVDPLGPERFV